VYISVEPQFSAACLQNFMQCHGILTVATEFHKLLKQRLTMAYHELGRSKNLHFSTLIIQTWWTTECHGKGNSLLAADKNF